MSVPEPGLFGALGSWVASVGGCVVASLRLADGVLGVTGKSEMDHCCDVSFCILDKRYIFLGQDRRGHNSCHFALDHRGKGGIFPPISARNPAEIWLQPLEIFPKKSMELLSFLVLGIQILRC